LLLGGDKAERRSDWDSWYDRNVKVADGIFQRETERVKSTESSKVAVEGSEGLRKSKGSSSKKRRRQ
jgi:hypothetical protein